MAADDDPIIGQLQELAGEAKSEHDGFQKRSSKISDQAIARELGNLYSMVADLSHLTTQAHADTFDELEDLKEPPETQFLPDDAMRLKSLLLALSNNLREPTGSSDDVPAALKSQVAEAVAFIDEATLEIDPEDDDADDDDDDGDADEKNEDAD